MPTNKDINEALLLDILSVYADAEDKLLTAVAKRVAKGITEEGWNEKKLKNTQALQKEIEKILGSTSKLSKAKISKGIIDAYKQGFAGVGGPKGTHGTILDELDIPMNLKMQVLATNNLLDNATFQVLRKANDAYQEVMAHSTTGLLAGVDTRIQASQKMLNEFASKGITSFVDKAGRNWDLSSYAEMCARTVGSHAALQGHIDRQVEVGEDLVKVSTIGTTCPVCQRWQGVVLSISGNHPKYHSIDEAKAAGLFHPNCKHTLGMYIPELDDDTDHEGKVEPAPLDMNSKSSKRNKLIEQQRGNERKIRYWKKRKALAITSDEQKKCDEKIKYWQHTNLLHCEKNSLRRQYAREGVMKGVVGGQMGNWGYGGHLKAYEELYKDVIGESPKKAFGKLKMQLQLFGEKSYDKWLKEEIQSLDQLDIDKAMMKDASNKNVTPTSLYKKYIGDNPIDDYAQVSLFHKGTKEFKSHYAKWLKTQIEEIGVSYKVKPQYTEVHEDIPEEDTKLSATEIYKKYHNGEKPTDAYKKLGGEESTGMKYGKWVEMQKKELVKNGITKQVPFGNTATQKTVDTITQATQVIDDAKEALKKDALDKFKKELDTTVKGQYDGFLKVKEQLEVFKQDMGSMLESEKLDLAKAKHLEMVKKKAEKTYGGTFDSDLDKLKKILVDEKDPIMKAHIQSQIDAYEEIKQEKLAKEAAAKAKVTTESGKVTLGRETKFTEGHLVKRDAIYQKLDRADLEKLSDQVKGHKMFVADNRRDILGRDRIDGHNHHMGHKVAIKSGLTGEDKELAEAFALAYDEYFNTIKCGPINEAYLKGYDKATPAMRKKIDAINRCIQSVELDEPIVLHRYIGSDVVDAIFKTTDVSTLRPGSLYENNTFMSTSTGGHPTFGNRKYMITLQVDKGTHALPTINHEELEVLLGKGKLEVVRTNKYSGSNPNRLQNYDGSYTNFVGDEIVVRYVEDGKAYQYEEVTPEKIENMLASQTNVTEHTQESKKWIKSLSAAERTASKRYTGSFYSDMNDVYRRDERGNKNYVKWSEDLTTALRRATTNKPVVLRRGINKSDLAHMLGFNGDTSQIDAHWDEINSGNYAAQDKGFLSTSPMIQGGFSKDVELRIFIPTGSHAAYVDSISVHKGEEETLLQSGSIFKVHKIENIQYKGRSRETTIAYLELLGTD